LNSVLFKVAARRGVRAAQGFRIYLFIMNAGFNRRFFSSINRPFRILGVQQIAVGGLDKSRLAALWGPDGLFGLTRTGQFRSERENVDEDILRAGSGPFAVEVDIMAPIDPTKSPKVHDPALNHIGLWVDDLQTAVKWLQSKGMRFTPGGIRKGAAGFDVCFIHPKGNAEFPMCGEGVLIELVQAPNEVKDATSKLM
jgi:lactoylglutathione lyase